MRAERSAEPPEYSTAHCYEVLAVACRRAGEKDNAPLLAPPLLRAPPRLYSRRD